MTSFQLLTSLGVDLVAIPIGAAPSRGVLVTDLVTALGRVPVVLWRTSRTRLHSGPRPPGVQRQHPAEPHPAAPGAVLVRNLVDVDRPRPSTMSATSPAPADPGSRGNRSMRPARIVGSNRPESSMAAANAKSFSRTSAIPQPRLGIARGSRYQGAAGQGRYPRERSWIAYFARQDGTEGSRSHRSRRLPDARRPHHRRRAESRGRLIAAAGL